MATPRLSSEDWIAAGFRALVARGPAALQAEPLARELGTTKGSFYWHFKDVPAFHAAMARSWEIATLAALAAAADAGGPPAECLNHLADFTAPQDPGPGGAAAEVAVRAWARSNETVARALAEVDRARTGYLAALLGAMGLANPDFTHLVYGAHVGMTMLTASDGLDRSGALSTLMAALTALAET